MPQLVLELAQQQLARLAGAQATQALELADLLLLGLLELRRLVLQVAGAVLERAILAVDLGQAQVQRLLLRDQPLLGPRDLGAALTQLEPQLGVGLADRRDNRRRCAERCRGLRHRCRLRDRRVRGLVTSVQSGGVARAGCSRRGRATSLARHHDNRCDCCGHDRRKHDFHSKLSSGRRTARRAIALCRAVRGRRRETPGLLHAGSALRSAPDHCCGRPAGPLSLRPHSGVRSLVKGFLSLISRCK